MREYKEEVTRSKETTVFNCRAQSRADEDIVTVSLRIPRWAFENYKERMKNSKGMTSREEMERVLIEGATE